jgi:hypothetical protein
MTAIYSTPNTISSQYRLYNAVSRPFPKPATDRIAVKVINHLGDEVMKVFNIN